MLLTFTVKKNSGVPVAACLLSVDGRYGIFECLHSFKLDNFQSLTVLGKMIDDDHHNWMLG